jgi:hypothetical protein
MTRRTWGLGEINLNPDAWEHFGFDESGRFSFRWKGGDCVLNVRCPYGGVGDRLWGRETWKVQSHPLAGARVLYRAGGEKDVTGNGAEYKHREGWRSSMLMYRWASRIDAEITELRVERLHDISHEDAKREGGYTVESYIQTFLKLNHIEKDTNPWNWAVGFRLLPQPAGV